MIKTITILFSIILIFILAISIYICFSGPHLPKETDGIITEDINYQLPQLVIGQSGYTDFFQCLKIRSGLTELFSPENYSRIK